MSQNYQPYAEYKDSGVEWLGDIPGHWEVIPLKHVSTCNDDVLPESTPESFEFEYIDIGSVSKIGGVVTKESFTFSVAPSRARRKVKSGDVLVSTVRTYLEAVAGISEKEQNCIASTGFAVIRPKTVDSGFAKYYMISPYFIGEVVSRSTGVSYPAINSSELTKIPISFPPIKEQRTIAAFLDHETARIDLLIAKQQRLIELLKEKRQAVISHAVTKGLNPNVPMKDSGVEWLGEVPEEWRVMAINQVTQKITNGYVGPTRDILVQSGVSYVQATHIKNGRINFDRSYFVSEGWSQRHKKSILQKGDVLVVQTGAGTGDIGLVTEHEEGCNCHALIILQPVKKDVFGSFLSFVLRSTYGQSVLYSIRTGGMHPHLNCSEVKFLKTPIPPLPEQAAICSHIEQAFHKYDQLIDLGRKEIELLQERRTALISAAVTGKIDLRGWQASAGSANSGQASAKWPLVAENPAEYGEQP